MLWMFCCYPTKTPFQTLDIRYPLPPTLLDTQTFSMDLVCLLILGSQTVPEKYDHLGYLGMRSSDKHIET